MVLFFGLMLLVMTVPGMATENDLNKWPSTTGTVMGGYVQEYYKSGGGKNPTWNWFYYPHVSYVYNVNGAVYQSENIWLGDMGTTSSAWAFGIIDQYPAGSSVTVYYNPSNPSQSVLEKTSTGDIELALSIFAIALVVAGTVGVLYSLIRAKKRAAADGGAFSTQYHRAGADHAANPGGTYAGGDARYPPAAHGMNYGVQLRDDWLDQYRGAGGADHEPRLWEGRPERTPYLLIFPEQSILVMILVMAFASVFVVAGISVGQMGMSAIGLGFIGIFAVAIILRIRSSSARFPEVRYALTTGHLILEGGRYTPINLPQSGPQKLQEAIAMRKQTPPPRYMPLGAIRNPSVRISPGQRLFKVGSIYAEDEKWPLIECVKEPEKVLKLIQEAAWKAERVRQQDSSDERPEP
jgi:hypothetical protein